MYTLDELIELVCERLDQDELLEILNIDTLQLCNSLEFIIESKQDEILEHLNLDEDEDG